MLILLARGGSLWLAILVALCCSTGLGIARAEQTSASSPVDGNVPEAAQKTADFEQFTTPIVLTPPAEKVAGVVSPSMSLSGTWQFHTSPPANFFARQFDTADWKAIEVPGEWFMQGFDVPANTAAGYRRTFRVPDDYKGKRIKLRFDAVYSDATVWVNGHEVGRHVGGLTPFEFDVTEFVGLGTENTLALAVRRESVADLKMTTFGTAYIRTPLGGIPRKIMLFAVPDVHLESLHVATTFDRGYHDATLALTLSVVNEGSQPIDRGELRVALVDPQGKQVDVAPKRLSLPAIEPGAQMRQQVDIPVVHPRKWDSEHPNLYVLTCEVLTDGKTLQVVRRRVGFRQVEVRGRQLFVNNCPVKLRGVCRHERHATLGRSLTPELWRKDIELFRNANINLIRTSHYPPPEGLLDVCDELGMFVESEAPFHHAQYILDPEYRRLTLQQTAEMIEQHRDHPSVIIWSLGNESLWSPNFEASAEMVRRLDPTRPRLIAGGSPGYFSKYKDKPMPIYNGLEIGTWHYPGLQKIDSLLDAAKRPLLFDEYCHLNCYNLREQATDPGIRDDWGHRLVDIWEKMYAHEACLGGALWGGIDEIVFPPSGPPAGWGAWGLIDSWHRIKPEYWHAKKAYSPVRIAATQLPLPAKGEAIRIPVANRHDFTNINELEVTWRLGDESGETSADIQPRAAGELLVRPSQPPSDGDVLQLTFHSHRGFLVDTYRLTFGNATAPQLPAPSPEVKQRLHLVRGEDAVVAANDRFTWTWDAKTGLLREATLDGRAVLAGGPHLMLLPRKRENYRQTILDEKKYEPFTATCTEWQSKSVDIKETEEGVQLHVEGQYHDAKGSYHIDVDSSGQMVVQYRFEILEEIDPRQIGLVLDLPRSFDSLSWRRNGLWTVYPEDHIGRPQGCAHATRGDDWPAIDAREYPPWPWSLDSTALGTNDFRATRTSVLWAALRNPTGQGVLVDGGGRQAVRTWIDDQRVHLLVADYSTGSGEIFLITRSFWQPNLLKKGAVVKGCVRVRLTDEPRDIASPSSQLPRSSCP